VILVFSTKGQRYLRVGLAVPLLGSVAGLRRMVADEGKLSPDQVTEGCGPGFPFEITEPHTCVITLTFPCTPLVEPLSNPLG